MVGDSSGGIPPSSVAAHEYGHHVAHNRVNSPWLAIDWGTKRWASAMNICSRVAAGTAVPGDEDVDYMLNPGEAFAESYRVLNESQAGLPLTWPIVDRSFLPDANALEALRADVLQPWTEATTQTLRVRFARGKQTWTRILKTPLDGDVSVALKTGGDDLRLFGGGALVARAVWTAGGGKTLETQVCGRRSFVLRLTRYGGARSITLRLSLP
jgi:hypothetical protein